MNRPITTVTAIACLAAFPSTAAAHLVTTGLGPFYDGGMHLLFSPGDLLGLVAILLLAGLRGARAARLAVVTLPATWFLAGLAGLVLPVRIDLPWLSVLAFMLLGALVALNPKLPPVGIAVLAGLYGALQGVLNGSALASIGAGWLTVLGITLMALIIGLLCAAGVVSLRANWARIAVRVAGSWIAAVGMLMLGWLAKSGM